jgi:hypothetical protein
VAGLAGAAVPHRDDTKQVLWLVNVSLVASIFANVVYVAYDPAWLTSLGDLVTTGIGLTVLARLWQVFPFDFSGSSFNWDALARFVLVVAIVGSIIGILVQFVSLVRLAIDGGARAGHRGGMGPVTVAGLRRGVPKDPDA